MAFIRAVRAADAAADESCEQHMTIQQPNSFRTGPDERGHFGIYGGRFVAETLMPHILELEAAYAAAKADPAYQKEMDHHLAHFVGRPSPLYFAERLTEHFGGAKIYFKREELNHTGAHKVNNVTRPDHARACAWARSASSPKPAPACTALRRQRLCAKFGFPASCIWARSTSSGSSRTCFA